MAAAAATRPTSRLCRRMTRCTMSPGACSPSTAACIVARSSCSMSVICGTSVMRGQSALRVDCIAQPGQRPRGLALYRAETASEHLGYLGLGQIVEVAQHEHCALAWWQARQCPEEEFATCHLGGVVGHTRIAVARQQSLLGSACEPAPPVD